MAQRVVGSVPAPLPQALQSVSIAAIDDPDGEVREAARARIKADARRDGSSPAA